MMRPYLGIQKCKNLMRSSFCLPYYPKESNQVAVIPSNLIVILEKENLLSCHTVLALCLNLGLLLSSVQDCEGDLLD